MNQNLMEQNPGTHLENIRPLVNTIIGLINEAPLIYKHFMQYED